jgi:hypothetical protein
MRSARSVEPVSPCRWWASVAFGQPIFRGDNFKTNVAVVDRIRHEVAERGAGEPDRARVGPRPSGDQHRVRRRAYPVEVDANDAGAEIDLTSDERATIDRILAGAAGRVREFTPLRPAMEPWGEEIPAR